MKTNKTILALIAILPLSLYLISCESDINDTNSKNYPNAIATIKPINGGESFTLWVNEKLNGTPVNCKKSPYGNKEVRVFANINEVKNTKGESKIYINWMDSIRTKMAITAPNNEKLLEKYGRDGIEVVNKFGTVAEDGYLTLRFKTFVGSPLAKHNINLLVQPTEKEPYRLILTHNANGDMRKRLMTGIIAFRLSEIDKIAQKNGEKDVTLQLHWKSYQGDKYASLKYRIRNDTK